MYQDRATLTLYFLALENPVPLAQYSLSTCVGCPDESSSGGHSAAYWGRSEEVVGHMYNIGSPDEQFQAREKRCNFDDFIMSVDWLS